MNDQHFEPPQAPKSPSSSEAVSPVHRSSLVQWSVGIGAVGMLVLRIGQIGIEFLTGLLLARLLGASGYGAYAFAMSGVGLLGVPAALGFDRLAIHEIARFKASATWRSMRGILRRSSQVTVITSVGLSISAEIWRPTFRTNSNRRCPTHFGSGS